MAKSGLYTGVDIGTNTIKVLVAEYISGEMNIIGVGNAKSEGLKNGIIVDIEKVAHALGQAIQTAEERAGIKIDKINVSIPATQLEMEPCQGMAAILGASQEITDDDVLQVVSNALVRGTTPEREIITLEATEFTVDGFTGISDPRGMFGTRLEMRGLVYTGPRTLIHNVRKVVERAGLFVENIVIAPLAMAQYVLSEGEREFGTIMVDLGAGQTTVTAVKDQQIKFTHSSPEGGDYITKDIAAVLETSIKNAEDLKVNYGEASTERASESETFAVDVVGQAQPQEFTELYLSQIIEARLSQILTRVRQDIDRNRLSEIPGGAVLMGGTAAMPGVVDVATRILGINARLFVPTEMGLRNPAFAEVISIVNHIGMRSEIDDLVSYAISGNYTYVEEGNSYVEPAVSATPVETEVTETPAPAYQAPAAVAPKQEEEESEGLVGRVRGMFGNLFD
ncbi:cell division protein FtsA [Lactococcus termiticola]|uniref:Cell division protein FtsA n=1 Tax=Lactococcus termiticola TaxID=2169526 RepID=A0A2R5HKF0_9LACT|nr:cell division protein FtsA [Lactococcus termiticola]GBG97021.1 cell division protein FtsA [Lactococcus termiticola]